MFLKKLKSFNWFAFFMLLPAIVVAGALIIYPLYMVISMSVQANGSMNFVNREFTGFTMQNFIMVFKDPRTWTSLRNSFVYTILSTVFGFLLGLGTALLLNRRFPGRRWIRTAILLPWAIPSVVAVMGFSWILDSSYGVFNYLLRLITGMPISTAWFADPKYAMLAVVIPTVWKGYPFFTLMLLAALQTIPGDLYEAARVDGANALHTFWRITMPSIKATAVLSLVLNGLWAFREVDFILPTTGGGPAGATQTMAVLIYDHAFKFYKMGTASALGIVTLVVCLLLVLCAFGTIREQYFGGGAKK